MKFNEWIYYRLLTEMSDEEAQKILGVNRNDPNFAQNVQQAWKKLALQNHPDRGGDHEAMVRVNNARDILMARRPSPTFTSPQNRNRPPAQPYNQNDPKAVKTYILEEIIKQFNFMFDNLFDALVFTLIFTKRHNELNVNDINQFLKHFNSSTYDDGIRALAEQCCRRVMSALNGEWGRDWQNKSVKEILGIVKWPVALSKELNSFPDDQKVPHEYW